VGVRFQTDITHSCPRGFTKVSKWLGKVFLKVRDPAFLSLQSIPGQGNGAALSGESLGASARNPGPDEWGGGGGEAGPMSVFKS